MRLPGGLIQGGEIYLVAKPHGLKSNAACLLVDQSSPNFFGSTWEGWQSINLLSIFGMSIHSRYIRGQSLKLPKIAPNFQLG